MSVGGGSGTATLGLGSGSTIGGGGAIEGGEANINFKVRDVKSIQKPGMRKTSAAEDERTVFADITGDILQSVQIFTQASGVVEVFKPEANGPVLSDIQVTDESLNMTLTFPAAQ